MDSHSISRRRFFFGTLLAGALPARGFGSVASLTALGYKPYSSKLNVAAIGCGGQGALILEQAAREGHHGDEGPGRGRVAAARLALEGLASGGPGLHVRRCLRRSRDAEESSYQT